VDKDWGGHHLGSGRPLSLSELSRHPDLIPAARLADENLSAYYGLPLVAKGRIVGLLSLFGRDPLLPQGGWRRFAETIASQTSTLIERVNLYEALRRSNLELVRTYDATLEGWARALDMRDGVTEGHSRRVADLAVRLGHSVGMQGDDLIHLRRGALIHDIGKMAVPDAILNKPGPLTPQEWRVMRQHPDDGLRMLWDIPYLRPALEIPHAHHEHWDGSGYPRGLAGEAIPLSARIFAVVDAWDAMRSERPYQVALPAEEALARIVAAAGSHFDPSLIPPFIQMVTQDGSGRPLDTHAVVGEGSEPVAAAQMAMEDQPGR
jgi:HD-GYP domain-containing protein (c-di-GMP phosphodiesterase class II)